MTAIELDHAYNVRDLGGLSVAGGGATRCGIVYRGDSLDSLSGSDMEILVGRLGIGAVIDLRSREESNPPDWGRWSVAYHRYPLVEDGTVGKDPFPSENPMELANVYFGNTRRNMSSIKEIFSALEHNVSLGIPCIFHCAAGRDRAGLVSAILLSLVNVSDVDVSKDYVRSNRHAHAITRRLAENPIYWNDKSTLGWGDRSAQELTMLRPETIGHYLRLIREQAGGVESFLLNCGVEARCIEFLRSGLTEGATNQGAA